MFKNKILIFVVILICGALVGKIVIKKIIHKARSTTIDRRYIPTKDVNISMINYDGTKVFAASSLDRIFQDGRTLLKPHFSTSSLLFAAKNEYESFQIVLQTGQKQIENVSVNLSDLIDSQNNSKIEKSNISFRVVGYVPSSKPYYKVKYVGNWPDPLLPFQKINIAAHTTQPFWITIYVPSTARAGQYKTTITINADGQQPWSIPITLNVYNFELPKQNHLKTAFDFYDYLTKKQYPQAQQEKDDAYKERISTINEKYIISMLQYRMNPVLNIDPTSQSDLSRIDRYLVYGLNNFAIGKKGGTFDNNWPKTDEEIENLLSLYQTYGEDLKLNQMLDYTYIYTWDEGDMGNPIVSKVASMIHRAYPGLKNMVCYHGLWNPDDFPNWGKDFDIWCFNIDNFDETKLRRLQKMGIETWMYVSGPSDNGTPNLALDFDSIDYRILSWLCWKYDIKGLLYWCVNWWPDIDPFKSTKNTKWEQNDNGLLFYRGSEGPLSSLRLEIFRDGMEDYEYIQLLYQDLKLMKQKGLDKIHNQLFNEGIEILKIDSSIASEMAKFTKNEVILLTRRNAIASKIEQIQQLINP